MESGQSTSQQREREAQQQSAAVAVFVQPRKAPRSACQMCGKGCNYSYYGVQCCEGCKQFFRRSVVKRSAWLCSRDGNCAIGTGREQCKACRLDQCLRVGMQWGAVNVQTSAEAVHFFVRLEERKSQLTTGLTPIERTFVLDERCSDARLLQHLHQLARCRERIWSAYYELSDGVANRFERLEDLLGSGENILGRANAFSEHCVELSQSELVKFSQEIEQAGHLAHPRILRLIVVDRLLVFGFAKALPVFPKLAPNDQAVLVRHLAWPITFFCGAYYSSRLRPGLLVRSDGFNTMGFLRNERFRHDPQLARLADRLVAGATKPFLRTQIDAPEEFALLLGILHAHSAVAELSPGATQLLQTEQQRYSQMLLRLLQARLGGPGGACRYAEYLLLVESAFSCARNHELFNAYLEAIHSRKEFESAFPKCLRAIM